MCRSRVTGAKKVCLSVCLVRTLNSECLALEHSFFCVQVHLRYASVKFVHQSDQVKGQGHRSKNYAYLSPLIERKSCLPSSQICSQSVWTSSGKAWMWGWDRAKTVSVGKQHVSRLNDAVLASRLIYAWPLRPDRWLVGARFVDSWRSFGCVLLLNQIFWKQCTIRQYTTTIYLINLEIGLGLGLDSELHYFSIFHRE